MHGGHHFFAEAEKREINYWKGFQEKRSFKKADGFIAVSNYVKVHTAKYLNYDGKPIEIINYPIDFTIFTPSIIPKVTSHLIVFAGTICEKKGVRQLIQAFQIVRNSFPNSQLHLYGRDWKFKNGKSYIQQIKDDFTLEELAKITFMGAVTHTELPSIYESAQVCVFPSHMETQGLVAPEAMAMEKVVLFSDVGPGPETIVDGETGFLVNPHQPQDIADKILYCFNNFQLISQIGINARKAAMIKFNQQTTLEKNLNFYNTILKEKFHD